MNQNIDNETIERDCHTAGLTIVNPFEGISEYDEQFQKELENMELPETVAFEVIATIDTAKCFYLVPAHSIAIPLCKTSHSLLVESLVERSDFTSSQELVDYPLVSEPHLLKHFSSYTKIERNETIRVITPTWLMSERAQKRLKEYRAASKVIKYMNKNLPSITIDI